jgi:predicted anti-sigma-YlaC factor YlaD
MSLLGPSGPEVSCEECFEHLDEYVEGRDVPGMAAHLEGCPACREDYESLAALVRIERDGAQTEHD